MLVLAQMTLMPGSMQRGSNVTYRILAGVLGKVLLEVPLGKLHEGVAPWRAGNL